MHALVNTLVEGGELGSLELLPLSQMRSANKKHGNIGDVELTEEGDIVESWDAKYGKAYLREEIEEAYEKSQCHPNVRLVGFVTTSEPERMREIDTRIAAIAELSGIEFVIVTFDAWVDSMWGRSESEGGEARIQLARRWLIMYAEYICCKRRDVAPIDEPCITWAGELRELLRAP